LLPSDLTFAASDNGVRTFNNVILNTPGSQTLTATAAGPLTGTVTVTVSQPGSGSGIPGTGIGAPSTGTGTPGTGTGVTGTPTQRFVAELYLDLLNRPVDRAGLTFWVGLIDGGLSHTAVVRAIEGSTEFLTDQIQAAYVRLLHHPLGP